MSFTTSTYPGTDSDGYSYIQSRAKMNYELIDEYAQEMKAGAVFEAAEAINDNGHKFIYDGAHRFEAAKAAGVALLVHWKAGTHAEAEWLSLSANQRHGLRRSRADKQRVVKNALLHANAASLSNREIGRHTGVDHKTVGKLRKELELSKDIPRMDERTVTRDGKTFTQAAKAEPQAAKEPKYATIWELERDIRTWLNSKWHKAPKVHIEVLGDIKNKAVKGPVRLQELVNGDLLPGPRRKRDVVQAVNNVLDQMNHAQRQQKRNDTLVCHNCNEQTIQATNIGEAIHCTTCGDEWIGPADFERDKAAYEEASKNISDNITPIAHAKTCPLCKSTVYYGISACIECHNCTAYWPTEEAFLADVETETQETTEADRDAETQAAPPANQPIFARVPCPKCNEMKIEITPIEDSVLCHSCDKTWTLDTFHKERMAPRMTSAQPIAEMTAGDQTETTTKPDPSLADHPATMMQRLGLVERLNTLAQTIPDEHLDTFETWVAELEDEFQPAYTA